MIHNRSTYGNHGRRCDVCRADHAEYQWSWRERRGTLAPDDFRHGTLGGYLNYDCRCLKCTEAKQQYDADYRARKAAS